MLAVIGSSLLLIVVLWVLRPDDHAAGACGPLNRVERHMGVVRVSGTLGLLTEAPRADEIGSLVTSFNSMLRQLKDLREQLEVQSFTLGRSESAVAVMHNVRNALNPISTILSQGLGRSPVLDRTTMDKALAELARGDIPDARRQKLVAFLAAAAHAVDEEREDRRHQLELGRTALHHGARDHRPAAGGRQRAAPARCLRHVGHRRAECDDRALFGRDPRSRSASRRRRIGCSPTA
ncbi:MAG: HAMP domain-containing protein [Sphingomonas sp.]